VKKFVPFPKISQFSKVKKLIRKYDKFPKIIDYEGTIKLHGTNAAITLDKENNIRYQSRNRVLTPIINDNQGFAEWAFQ